MKIIGVIPARWASTRFPGKPLALIQGRPMIQWVIEGARKSRKLSEIIVATDHESIKKAAEEVQCSVVMTDPQLLTGTDRVYQATKNISYDVAINIQGDEPLIDEKSIDALADVFSQKNSLEMATLAHPISESDLKSENSVKVVLNARKEAIYFSRFPIPHSRHDAKFLNGMMGCLKHIGLYAYSKVFLKRFCEAEPALIERAEGLEQLRALYMGARIHVVEVSTPTVGIDTPGDLKRLEEWLRKKND